jgi:hypothetical protein
MNDKDKGEHAKPATSRERHIRHVRGWLWAVFIALVFFSFLEFLTAGSQPTILVLVARIFDSEYRGHGIRGGLTTWLVIQVWFAIKLLWCWRALSLSSFRASNNALLCRYVIVLSIISIFDALVLSQAIAVSI